MAILSREDYKELMEEFGFDEWTIVQLEKSFSS